MKVIFHPGVQRDVSKILRHCDTVNDPLGDIFPIIFSSAEIENGIRVLVVRHQKQHSEYGAHRE